MKKRNKIVIFVVCVISVASCSYLDVVPDNIATIDYAFRNQIEAENYLYGCYSYRPKIGDIDNDPAMVGADEIWQRYLIRAMDRFRTWEGSRIRRGEQNVTNPVMSHWDGWDAGRGSNPSLWTGIRDCNIFLENVHKAWDTPPHLMARWISEAKFLKAYYHFCLMKRYGPIPIVDQNLPVDANVDEVQVYREPIDRVVEYISMLLLESVADLPKANELLVSLEAGRADQCVAMTLRAEVLLFAASPLFNGNTDYAGMLDPRTGTPLFPQESDPEKWTAAAAACREAIDMCHAQGKKLYNVVHPYTMDQHEVFQQQTTYRQTICDRWNTELIWGGTNNDYRYLALSAVPRLVRLGTALASFTGEYSPTLNMAASYYSSNGVPINEDRDWATNGWFADRYKVRDETSSGDEKYYIKEGERTVYLHYNREPRFYASLGIDKGVYYGSGYNTFETVKYADFFNVVGASGYQGGDSYPATGYTAKKMHSFLDAQTNNQGGQYDYFPFPIFRLADLYLMYAEALNEMPEGSIGQIEGASAEDYFTFIDMVRARAGLEGVRESWSQYSVNPSKPDSRAGRRAILQQERRIELAFEAKRFWDVRRWKQIEEFNMVPEGWNIMGETAEDFYIVLSLPREPIRFTVKDYFWPIKESNLYVNRNLTQNYGW